ALVDAARRRRLLDAFAGIEREAAAIERLWNARRDAFAEVETHRAEAERAAREADWLRHAVEELTKLAPQSGEETALADKRAGMMQAEKVATDLRAAHEAVAGSASPVPALSAAIRRLERRTVHAPNLIEPAVKALDGALGAIEEARARLQQALALAEHDPAALD